MLDLYSEVAPVWQKTKSFYGSPFIWSGLPSPLPQFPSLLLALCSLPMLAWASLRHCLSSMLPRVVEVVTKRRIKRSLGPPFLRCCWLVPHTTTSPRAPRRRNMLHNFGGRPGLYARLSEIAAGPARTRQQTPMMVCTSP